MAQRRRFGKWQAFMILWIVLGIGWIVLLSARDGLGWASFLLGETSVVFGMTNCFVQMRRERREARKATGTTGTEATGTEDRTNKR